MQIAKLVTNDILVSRLLEQVVEIFIALKALNGGLLHLHVVLQDSEVLVKDGLFLILMELLFHSGISIQWLRECLEELHLIDEFFIWFF